jgi:ferredoxin
MVLRTHVNRDVCLGNAVCVGLLPQHFELDDSDVAVVTGTPTESDAQRAIRACPTQAIYISDDET